MYTTRMLWKIWYIVILQSDEPAPVGNYNQRKEEEGEKLLMLSEQLDKLTAIFSREDVTKDSSM